jgi:SGNH domain (fused to AT3 domains)
LISRNNNPAGIWRFALSAAVLAFALAPITAAPANAYQKGLCAVAVQTDDFFDCHSGNPDSKLRVALIGDSHTRSWFGPVSEMAAKYDWSLTVVSKSACPPLDPTIMPGHLPSQTCVHWNQQLVKYLKTTPAFGLVINASSSFVTQGQQSYGAAFASMAKKITATGAKLLVIRDNPKPLSNFQDCLKAHPKDGATACARLRSAALTPADPMPGAVAKLPGVQVLDLTNFYCGAKKCAPIIDGIVVYRDHSHISQDWAMHLMPQLEAAIPRQFKG